MRRISALTTQISTVMPRYLFTSLIRLFSIGLLALLAACAQQQEPGYYETGRGSTESDALHRARGNGSTVAPAQLQLGFGEQSRAALPEAAEDVVPAPGSGATPGVLAEARTYLGTLPCPDGGACPATRMTLSLAPDGQWRSRSMPLDGSNAATAAMGCWFITDTSPVRIVLESGEQHHASLEFIQSNVIRVTRLNSRTPLLESRLTRQADIDPIDELAAEPSQQCPAR